jgi:hypothetical protein
MPVHSLPADARGVQRAGFAQDGCARHLPEEAGGKRYPAVLGKDEAKQRQHV